MGTPYKYPVPDSGTFIAKNCRAYKVPFTASLTSADAGRAIEVSVDNGTSWIAAALDFETPETIAVVINAPVSLIRFTGAPDDVVRIIAA